MSFESFGKAQIEQPQKQKKRTAELKPTYLEKYFEHTEGMEALSGMITFFEEEELMNLEKNKNKRAELLQSLTEYQFLLTHFVLTNSQDKEMLALFWETARSRAGEDYKKRFKMLKRGVLTQAAIFHIYERMGKSPKLSHPAEDAFGAIDMWTGIDKAVQIKGDQHQKKPIIIDADEVDFPGVELDSPTNYRWKHYNNGYSRFRIKLKKYCKKTGRDINAFYIVLPHKSFDSVTGEPNDKTVEFFRDNEKELLAGERIEILKKYLPEEKKDN